MNLNLRRVVIVLAALNLGYFGVEFAVAIAIGSVSLFADSIDFLEDASLNFLVAFALGWSATGRARLGMVLAGILLIPGLATLWQALGKLIAPVPPSPLPLTLAGLGALAINLSCAFMLARFRAHCGSLTRAAFLSARNDAIANVAIIAAGLVTAYTHSAWPDLIVGLGVVLMNADAAHEVWRAAREEHRAAHSDGIAQLKRSTGPGPAVAGLACALLFVFAVPDASASEHAAVLELGASVESELPLSGAHVGPSLAVETTPIEDWLELEFGVAVLKSHHATEWETDLLFKKPYTWSSTVEFMVGLGPTWTRTTEPTGPTSTMGAEFALDFMFWPRVKWGWFLEPAYGIAFARGHSQSVGVTFGILFGIH